MKQLLLSERMQELKSSAKPFTLTTFLQLYTKANHECYINYMEGAIALHSWLTSEGTIPLDFQVAKYPRIEDIFFTPPRLIDGGYESSEVAKIINNEKPLKAKRAIYLTMIGLYTNG